MDLNQIKAGLGVGGVGKAQPGNQSINSGNPAEFRKALQDVAPQAGKPTNGAASAQNLIFSKHAVERVRSRNIQLGPENLQRLNTAFEKASSKGSKDTLVLMDDSAFIMNVKNKTIVTAMDKGMLKENLFTNIDSTIIV